jgi:RNA polymerase sigma-70 factor (ECF subfamily)
MDEQQAIQRLKRGDIGGLEILVNVYQVRAVRTAYLITRDVALAEDVVQDAFLQTYRSIRHFDQDRPFGPWFMRSVVNAAVKVAQKTARQVTAIPASDDSTLEDLLAAGESVEEQVESTEFQRQVWEAMQSLSPRQRAAVVQRYFLEMSEREMAAELEAAPGTVKWLLHVARERLRSLLSERSAK